MLKPKELRNVNNGRIFAYTDALAELPNMVPHWKDGVDPNRAGGLDIGESVSGQINDALKSAMAKIEEKNATISELRNKIDAQAELIAMLNKNVNAVVAENDELKKAMSEAENSKMKMPSVQSASERQTLINNAVRAILAEENPDELTTTGLPRVEAIEARAQIQDINAAERNIAVEAAKKG